MSIKSWITENLNPREWPVRTRVIVAGATALVLAGGGVATAFALQQEPGAPVASATPSRTSMPTPTPTPTPTKAPKPKPADLPRAAVVDGVLKGWQAASPAVIADVLPQVGAAADGEVAAFIDAPAVAEPTIALRTTATVVPGEEYTFSAKVRALYREAEARPVRVRVGETKVAVPPLNARWAPIEATFTPAAGQTTVDIVFVVDAPIEGFGIDDVSLSTEGGDNVVPNPSFEGVDGGSTLASDSLVLRQDSAALGVRMAPGDAHWTATRYEDGSVVEGTATLRDGVSAVPLEGVSQGFYTVAITDAAGGSVSAPVIVLDYEGSRIPKDTRLGAATHLERPAYFDGGEALASLGLSAARNDIKWSQNETSPGQYNWTQTYVDEFGKLKAQGMDLLGVIDSGNPLYTGVGGQAEWQKLKTPPSGGGVDAFARFAAAAADRFDVIGIEVWNEFNHEPFNKGCRTPECYLPILQATEAAVQAVDPEMKIVAGATANYDSAWLNRLWQLGALANSDAASFHPYDIYFDPDGAARDVASATSGMAASGTPVPVWITELGWTTGGNTVPVDYNVQANNLIRAEANALGAGAGKYFWYDLINDSAQVNKQGDAHEANFGLFEERRRGLSALAPKPSAFAQSLLASKIAGHEGAKLDGIQGVNSVRFGPDGNIVRVAWVASGSTTVEYEATGDITVTDAWGKVSTIAAVGGKVSVPVGRTPLFLEGAFTK